MPRAQISLEAMIAIIILLSFFLVTMWLLVQINLSSSELRSNAAEADECSRVSGLVQEVFIQGPGTQVKTTSGFAFQITSRSAYFPTVTCDFSAAAEQASLLPGTILLYNSNGIVVVQNA